MINRKVQIWILLKGWVDFEFLDLKKGMKFRMFESDGTPVLNQNTDIFIATTDAYMRDDIPTIEVLTNS